jgi:hypothetical protein
VDDANVTVAVTVPELMDVVQPLNTGVVVFGSITHAGAFVNGLAYVNVKVVPAAPGVTEHTGLVNVAAPLEVVTAQFVPVMYALASTAPENEGADVTDT